MFTWWAAIGDDFHVTQQVFTSAPFGPRQLTKRQRRQLAGLLPELEEAMSDNVVFKLNAGKHIGNYATLLGVDTLRTRWTRFGWRLSD